MKTNLLLISATALMVASCSNESIIDSELNKATNAIDFTSYTSVTKGNPVDNNEEFLKAGTFGVTAFISGTSTFPYMGYKDKGASIKSDGKIWSYANPNELAYWPTGGEKLDFYAYSPFGNTAITLTQTFDKEKGLTLNYTVPAAEGDQVDLMFAEAKGVGKPTTGNAVNLPFKHALTQVHFGIATKTDRLKIDVAENGIIINNIKSKGVFAASTAAWSNLLDLTTYTVTSAVITAGYKVDDANKYAKVGTDDAALMLIPQTFVAATMNESAAGSVNNDGSYLTISCKIYQMLADGTTKVYLHGSEGAFEDIEVPISSKGVVDGASAQVWLRNNKVTYNLLIGAGSAGGLDPIEFTTEVEKWLDTDGGVVENK